MLKAADLVDRATARDGPEAGDQLRPLLEFWKAKYLAARDRKSAAEEVRELIDAVDA